MNTIEPVRIWTDGAALPTNPGPGGWAFLKQWNGKKYQTSGSVRGLATNVQMEMVAVLQALRSLKRLDVPVVVYSDLEMIPKGMNEWMDGWIANAWRNSAKKPVANRDIWEAIKELADQREESARIAFEWVRGHAGQEQNEIVDGLANGAAQTVRGATSETRFDPVSGLMLP